MKKNLDTILVVDDSQSNLKVLVELLGEDYDIIVAQNGLEAIDIIKEESEIDLILLDVMMPKLNGYDTCLRIKKIKGMEKVPIIFLTAKTDEESIQRAYDVGGIDYIRKPFLHKELILRIKTQLELKSLIKELNFFSSYDSMTKLYNRRVFFKKSKDLLKNTQDNIFVAMIDIDDFKSVNDTFGHDSGDLVIKHIAKIIKENFPDDVICGRLGGEEFAIVYGEESFENIKNKLEEVRKQIESLEILSSNKQLIKTTVSIGLSKKLSDDEKIDTLLKRADEALYNSKDKGKNKTTFREN